MGVTSIHGTEGATSDPPAAIEYAEDPDGVATIKPSACKELKNKDKNK